MDVIYLMGGRGKRANLGYPKQFARIKGKPLFIYGLEVIDKIKEIENIIIPSCLNEEDIFINIKDSIKNYNISKNIIFAKAGKTRQESVYNGLTYKGKNLDDDFGKNYILKPSIKSEYILIMEAVRPFITKEFIEKIINIDGNVIPYTKLNSTPFNKINGDLLNRNNVVMVQTPQKYVTEKLFKSHNVAISQGLRNCTDDLDLMKKIGLYWNYKYIEGPYENIKITYPLDLQIAETICDWRIENK